MTVKESETSVQPATLTIEEAAIHLRIGRTLAYRLAREGKLPGLIRLGSKYLVSRAALERALSGEA